MEINQDAAPYDNTKRKYVENIIDRCRLDLEENLACKRMGGHMPDEMIWKTSGEPSMRDVAAMIDVE